MTNHLHFLKVQLAILSVVGIVYLVAHIFDLHPPTHLEVGGVRRRLLDLSPPPDGVVTLVPWAQDNIIDVTERPDTKNEMPMFWHIPKSGGTTVKRLYTCLGIVYTQRLGADPRFGHDKDTEIVLFQPYKQEPDITFVNVDTTSKAGIARAAKMGLVPSGKVDMVFTTDVSFASQRLFDPQHKGRILCLFRNPVDRLVSKFYYLQTATWERTYSPQWAGMSVEEWAMEQNHDENFMVKKIMGKNLADEVDIGDLVMAKEIVRRRFVVGLMNDMEESIRRFNIMIGFDINTERGQKCMDEYFGPKPDTDNMNSHAHPKVEEGSRDYRVLAERNALDMVLWNYITLLYEEQKGIIDSYATTSR